VETRAVCQNVYGVPRALYCRQRIGYTLYRHTHTSKHTHIQTYTLPHFLSLSLTLRSVCLPFSILPFLSAPPSLCITDKTFQYVHVYRVYPFMRSYFTNIRHRNRLASFQRYPFGSVRPAPGLVLRGGSMRVFGLNS